MNVRVLAEVGSKDVETFGTEETGDGKTKEVGGGDGVVGLTSKELGDLGKEKKERAKRGQLDRRGVRVSKL